MFGVNWSFERIDGEEEDTRREGYISSDWIHEQVPVLKAD
jgi:hypothetical protein